MLIWDTWWKTRTQPCPSIRHALFSSHTSKTFLKWGRLTSDNHWQSHLSWLHPAWMCVFTRESCSTYTFLSLLPPPGKKEGRGVKSLYLLIHFELNIPFTLTLVIADHETWRCGVMWFHLLSGCLPRQDIRGQWRTPRLFMKYSGWLSGPCTRWEATWLTKCETFMWTRALERGLTFDSRRRNLYKDSCAYILG